MWNRGIVWNLEPPLVEVNETSGTTQEAAGQRDRAAHCIVYLRPVSTVAASPKFSRLKTTDEEEWAVLSVDDNQQLTEAVLLRYHPPSARARLRCIHANKKTSEERSFVPLLLLSRRHWQLDRPRMSVVLLSRD